ncbi:hypothetical protein [Hymenobacter terrenus]|uniref:hypothetical protein n=1 Tax=Hymenobacter terrenus TaxID=1629124 RepID=UPI0006199EF1|nr:hypothetical protein [Hymenobacter terrenus]
MSDITKRVTLGGRPAGDGSYVLDFGMGPPVLTKPEDLQSMETLALRLSASYEWVSLQAAPTGRLLAVVNHEHLLHTWEILAQSLRETSSPDDQITPTLLDFIGRQLQDPHNVLRSLRHDYLYQTLLGDFYDQRLGTAADAARTRGFSQFFDDLPLWFSEQVEVVPIAADEPMTLALKGTLDSQQTDVAAIRELMMQAVGAAADPALAPHFKYEATYVLDPDTGLPFRVELTVYGRLAELYNKEYTLTLQRI